MNKKAANTHLPEQVSKQEILIYLNK